MGLNSNHLNEDGYALCVSCRRKHFIRDMDQCPICNKWVCHECGTYLKQGYHGAYGYFCKRCMTKIRREG